MLKPQIGHRHVCSVGFCFFYSTAIRFNFFACWRKKKKAKQEQGRKNRVRRCWDLQQCLTVRNSVVYINCNLFHSLSGPGESCVCERAHKCLHACTYVHFSLRVSVCTHACYVSVYVRTPSWIRLAVYSVHYEASRCLQQYIYAAPQLASAGDYSYS